jgi:hypothetical protein
MFSVEQDKIFANVVTGLRQVAEVITELPEARRSVALDAAAQSYLNTARQLGYAEEDAQQWASAVMERLHQDMKGASSPAV